MIRQDRPQANIARQRFAAKFPIYVELSVYGGYFFLTIVGSCRIYTEVFKSGCQYIRVNGRYRCEISDQPRAGFEADIRQKRGPSHIGYRGISNGRRIRGISKSYDRCSHGFDIRIFVVHTEGE